MQGTKYEPKCVTKVMIRLRKKCVLNEACLRNSEHTRTQQMKSKRLKPKTCVWVICHTCMQKLTKAPCRLH